jgi:hypothetical protein
LRYNFTPKIAAKLWIELQSFFTDSFDGGFELILGECGVIINYKAESGGFNGWIQTCRQIQKG